MIAAEKEIVQDIFDIYKTVQEQIKLLNDVQEKLNDEQRALLTVLIFNYEQERMGQND